MTFSPRSKQSFSPRPFFGRALGLLLLLGAFLLGSCDVPTMRDCPGTHCGCNTPTDCYCNDAATPCRWSCDADGCKGRCNRDSDCTFEAGNDATLICDRANCAFTVAAGSTVHCINGGSCRVQCTSDCFVDCNAAGPCFVACSGETVARTVNGQASCDPVASTSP
jgi:hypothetical protein